MGRLFKKHAHKSLLLKELNFNFRDTLRHSVSTLSTLLSFSVSGCLPVPPVLAAFAPAPLPTRRKGIATVTAERDIWRQLGKSSATILCASLLG